MKIRRILYYGITVILFLCVVGYFPIGRYVIGPIYMSTLNKDLFIADEGYGLPWTRMIARIMLAICIIMKIIVGIYNRKAEIKEEKNSEADRKTSDTIALSEADRRIFDTTIFIILAFVLIGFTFIAFF